MLTHSFFRVRCLCGEELRSEAKAGCCPTCKREFRIEWPAEYQADQQQEKDPVATKTAAA